MSDSNKLKSVSIWTKSELGQNNLLQSSKQTDHFITTNDF